ncbi:MAG: hypothetical protein EHM37_18335 [Deltaproteobacteria bacterium]|jgi:hypothetical protein|nr:MAG: hypothetical protein EHM37_18335 [Deltaproteobacteria bacterium]
MTIDNTELETIDSERRRYRRVVSNNPMTYVLVNARGSKIGQGIGRVINVSLSGILLETYEYIGSKYIFLVSTDVEGKLIEIVGKVIFSREVSLGVFNSGISLRGEHEDNVKFRRDLIRVFHQRHVLGIAN